MNVETEVRQLLHRGYVATAYQPIVELYSGRVKGYEALLRGPAGSSLANPKLIFGPDAKLSKALVMDLDTACVAAGLRSGRLLVQFGLLFINLHIRTLLNLRNLRDHFAKLMDSSGVPPQALVVEISERSTTATPRAVARILRSIRKLGIRFALDDFGTAYSGLENLLWFEPEFIKIDRAFVLGINRSARKQAMVSSIVNLSKRLGGETIAEGVETSEELLTLMALDTPLAQGFHFGKAQGALFWAAEREMRADYKQFFTAETPLQVGVTEDGHRFQSLPMLLNRAASS